MPLPTARTPAKTTISDASTLLYGAPKIGKSTLASEAPSPIFLATEPGLNHLEVFQQPITSWEAMLATCAELAGGKHEFKTVVIDTVDRLYQLCVDHVNAKNGVAHESDLGYGKGYAMINGEFGRVLNKLAMLPYGLILISHSQTKEIETRTGKLTKTVPTLPTKARETVLALVDLVLFADVEKVPADGGKGFNYRRIIRTKPTAHYEAGDRSRRLPESLELSYRALADAYAKGQPAPKSAPEAAPANEAPAPTTSADDKPATKTRTASAAR